MMISMLVNLLLSGETIKSIPVDGVEDITMGYGSGTGNGHGIMFNKNTRYGPDPLPLGYISGDSLSRGYGPGCGNGKGTTEPLEKPRELKHTVKHYEVD
jgi:hypothetical protein